jgi:hypothetical protein
MSHPDEIDLVRLLDGETEPETMQEFRVHLTECGECVGRAASFGTLRDAINALHEEDKRAIPTPAWESWSSLTAPERTTQESTRSWRWLAVAASVLLAATASWWLLAPRRLVAAELLARAAAVEKASPRRAQRLRIVAAGRTIVRPRTVARNEGDPALRALFENAHYRWEDPLSAGAFVDWHDQLPRKVDTADRENGRYRIRTVTDAGPLVEAVLLLSPDLHPVRCVLRFQEDLIVELEEALEETARIESKPQETPSAPAPAHQPNATAADELELVLALHRSRADLGDPIEWTREEGRLIVTAMGLTEERVRELRAATAHIPRIEWRVSEASAPTPSGAARAQSNAAAPRTAGVLGGEIERNSTRGLEAEVDEMLSTSDTILARAHALRLLSERFDGVTVASLTPAQRTQLEELRHSHARALTTAVERLSAAIPGGIQPAPPSSARPSELVDAARRTDDLLNIIFAAPGGDTEANAVRLRAAIGQLAAKARGSEAQ